MERRVFVIGAGASIGHSNGASPGIGGFFKEAAHEIVAFEDDSGRSVLQKYNELAEFVDSYFSKSLLRKSEEINIEELMTIAVIEKQRNPSGNASRVEAQLKELIRELLLSTESKVKKGVGEYFQFEDQLLTLDTVITFNWDRMLDGVLSKQVDGYYHAKKRKNGHHPVQYQNFINSFVKLQYVDPISRLAGHESISRIKEPYTEWNDNVSYYLKLHGSLDWFVCLNHDCEQFGITFIVNEPGKEQFCAECHEKLNNALIPPVMNKSFSEYPIIRKIWNIAQKAMQGANEVVIWGYSMPPTDFYTGWLLRQARGERLKKVTVINPDVVRRGKNYTTLNVEYLRKIVNCFRGVLEKRRLTIYETFKDYVNSKDAVSKYRLDKNGRDVFRNL